MKNKSNSEFAHRQDWKLSIESSCLFVMLQQQDLVGPVENEEVQAANWVKSWQTTRVGHDGP